VALLSAFVAATIYLWATDPPALDALGIGRWGGAGVAPAAQAAAPEQPAERPSGITEAWANAPTNPNPFGTAAAVRQGAPTRVKIPSIGVDTSLESLHLDKTGVLTPPTDFAKAGWYADGTAPGDNGPAVIAGHVDSYRGPAVFYKLREMVEGDRIDVIRGGQTVHFTVVTTAWYPKTNFPTDKVYGPTPDRQLRLITCGGVFDHSLRSYKDNFVVYAVAG
jgi:LPXTG-site transpeptidase (sortase) family protein